MSSVFISYRRGPTNPYAGRLYDRLMERFGADGVFMDVDTIKPGADFVEHIRRAVSSCSAILVVIGPEWTDAQTKDGRRRLDDPDDLVRLEVTTGLERGITVVPVLVQGAKMPSPQELPEPLAPLARRNAIEISDVRWADDMRLLLATLERVMEPGAPRRHNGEPRRPAAAPKPRATARPRHLAWAAGAAVVAAGVVALLLSSGGDGKGGRTPGGAPSGTRSSAGVVRATIPVGGSPTGIATGADGVWVTNSDDATVTRLDRVSGQAVGRPVRGVGPSPDYIATDGGSAYATNGGTLNGPPGALSRIDPVSQAVVRRTPVGRLPTDVAISSGFAWVGHAAGTISKVELGSMRLVDELEVGGAPTRLAADGDRVFVIDGSSGGQSITVVDAPTGRAGPPIVVGRGPSAVAVGAGWIWVTCSADRTVVRLALDPVRRVGRPIPVGDAPGDVVVGAGAVWVVNESGNSVTRIDPKTFRVVGTVRVGHSPAAAAVDGDTVWVTNTDDGTVSRIDATP